MSDKSRLFLVKSGATTYRVPRLRFANGTLTFTAGEAVYTAPSGGGGSSVLTTNGDMLYYNAGDARLPIGANGRLLMVVSGFPAWSSASDVRTQLSLVPGTDVQAYDADLADIAGLSPSRGDIIVRNGSGWTRLPVGTANRILLSNGTDPAWASPADVRTALSLVVGTNVQAWDADLDGLAALGNGLPVRSGGTWTTATISAPLSLSGSTLSVAAATTTAAGVVELATDGETGTGVVVTGSDSRLGSAGGSAVGLAVWAGTGAGGTLTLDGTTAPSWGSWSTIGGVRTLTVSAAVTLEYDDIVWDFTSYSALAIVTKGAKVLVRSMSTTGTGTAYCDWSGGNASGATGGLGAAVVATASPLAGGQNGAAGRATTGSGTSPGAYNQGVCLGGLGGAGGAIGGSPGGAAGTFTRDYTPGASTYGSLVDFLLTGGGFNWASGTSRNSYQLSGGGGGGSGANQTTGTSGGGGGGAGVQHWSIGRLDAGSNAIYFRVRGGDGADGVAASGTGTSAGGAGGGAGAVVLVVGWCSANVYLQAHGGDGGDGTTVDADVAAGGAGGNGGLVACIYGSGTAPTGTATGGTGGTGSGGVVAASGATGTVHIVSGVI